MRNVSRRFGVLAAVLAAVLCAVPSFATDGLGVSYATGVTFG